MDWKIKKKAILYSLVLISIGSLIVTATYAVLLAILQGGIIEVVGLEGGISYSTDGINWTSIGGNLYNIPLGTSIFCRIEVTGSGYSGDVTITWKLLLSNVELYTLANYTTTNLTGNIGHFDEGLLIEGSEVIALAPLLWVEKEKRVYVTPF